MKKRLLAVILAVAFAAGTVGVAMAAKGLKCEVTAIDGNTVTMDCKDTEGLKVGAQVQVKAGKKAVEGC